MNPLFLQPDQRSRNLGERDVVAQPDLSAVGEAVHHAGDGVRQVLRAARGMVDLSGLRVALELTELADGFRMRRSVDPSVINALLVTS